MMNKFVQTSILINSLTLFNLIKFGSCQIPLSPFGRLTDICFTNVAPIVRGFPGSPHPIYPFRDLFRQPVDLAPRLKVCRNDSHCMVSYEIDIVDFQARPFDITIPGCRAKPGTWFIGYNGMIPGPTITVPSGHESLVRFNNKISKGYFKDNFTPCLASNARTGRPISVHLHGSASLAPYDGWAEDETCSAETKDYVYPNNRPTTGWYHDHALHITADNAYYGSAGMYIVSSKTSHGACGEPWNMDGIEERHLILSDKLINSECQLSINVFEQHKNNLYGDINLVSGIPFPRMPLQAKWYRFRLLNAATSRPYLVKIKNARLVDVGQSMCRVIASDGGYKTTTTQFPTAGILIGVGERYDIVCDFSSVRGQTLYLWNDHDTDRMKDVPYFCYSHLLARIEVGAGAASGPVFNEGANGGRVVNIVANVLQPSVVTLATAMATNDQAHRTFDFGRSNGHWTINGESWATFKIAAADVGQNTWELWKFRTGGGWFHPIHVHLIDFFLVRRIGGRAVQSYEFMTPKDVFYLGPGETVYTVARFGAHRGDYMFHCHNLIHEDDDMMRAMRITSTGMNSNQVTSQQYLTNPLYGIIYGNFDYADPMFGNTSAKPTTSVIPHTLAYINETLNKNLYRIFYPTQGDLQMTAGYTNPWRSEVCKF